jgi:hypothetical protein
MTCPVCRNQDVEECTFRDGVQDHAPVSYVGYHCHECNRVSCAPVTKSGKDGISIARDEAAARFTSL